MQWWSFQNILSVPCIWSVADANEIEECFTARKTRIFLRWDHHYFQFHFKLIFQCTDSFPPLMDVTVKHQEVWRRFIWEMPLYQKALEKYCVSENPNVTFFPFQKVKSGQITSPFNWLYKGRSNFLRSERIERKQRVSLMLKLEWTSWPQMNLTIL